MKHPIMGGGGLSLSSVCPSIGQLKKGGRGAYWKQTSTHDSKRKSKSFDGGAFLAFPQADF